MYELIQTDTGELAVKEIVKKITKQIRFPLLLSVPYYYYYYFYNHYLNYYCISCIMFRSRMEKQVIIKK